MDTFRQIAFVAVLLIVAVVLLRGLGSIMGSRSRPLSTDERRMLSADRARRRKDKSLRSKILDTPYKRKP